MKKKTFEGFDIKGISQKRHRAFAKQTATLIVNSSRKRKNKIKKKSLMKKYYEISIEDLIIDELLRVNLEQKVRNAIITKSHIKLNILKNLNYYI